MPNRRRFERHPENIPGLASLTRGQLGVLTRLLNGERAPGIAKARFLSQSAVRNRLSEIFRKFGVDSQEKLMTLLRADDNNLPTTRDDHTMGRNATIGP